MEVFTIGYSNHPIKMFLALLRQHGVTAVADVRSHPFSRYLPHFNQNALRAYLKDENMYYVFLGRELGARPHLPECYEGGKAVYEKIANTEPFAEGIQRLVKGSHKHRIALLCLERDPLTCHRAILVCRHLRQYNDRIYHIKSTGVLESHEELEERLLEKQGFLQFSTSNYQLSLLEPIEKGDISLPKADCLVEAYRLQGEEIAYTETKGEETGEVDESDR